MNPICIGFLSLVMDTTSSPSPKIKGHQHITVSGEQEHDLSTLRLCDAVLILFGSWDTYPCCDLNSSLPSLSCCQLQYELHSTSHATSLFEEGQAHPINLRARLLTKHEARAKPHPLIPISSHQIRKHNLRPFVKGGRLGVAELGRVIVANEMPSMSYKAMKRASPPLSGTERQTLLPPRRSCDDLSDDAIRPHPRSQVGPCLHCFIRPKRGRIDMRIAYAIEALLKQLYPLLSPLSALCFPPLYATISNRNTQF